MGIFSPIQGKISVYDMDVSDTISHIIEKGYIGYVATNPDTHIVNEIVYEEIAFGLENKMIPYNTIKLKVDTILKDLCIDNIKYSLYETIGKK